MKDRAASIRLMFVSPWLIAASIGLMTLIIVVFAMNNLRREKNLINDGLYHRGQALGRFVGAGTRAFMMQGMEGASQTQHLIEQASTDTSILYIAVLDSQGFVVAHSQPEQLGQCIERDFSEYNGVVEKGGWKIVRDKELHRNVFEVVSEFSPFMSRHNMMRNSMIDLLSRLDNARRSRFGKSSKSDDWCRNTLNDAQSKSTPGAYKILVGLDMTDQDKITSQARMHIVLVSLILLFVGVGGWLSLLAAQSFKATQNSLQHIQAFTNLLVMKLPVGIIATEQDGRIKTYNKAIADMLDILPQQVINRRPEKVLPEKVANFFENLRDDDAIHEQEIILNTNNKDLTVHVSSVPVVDDQNIAKGRVLLVHDLTELKRLQKEVSQHDRLVSLGKMAAGVAHEVRNPLSSIKGFATLLGAKFDKDSEEKKAATLLVNEVERLNRSITELLNYSKPLPLKLVETDLGDLLTDSLQLMQTDAQDLGVALQVDAENNLPKIFIDADRIMQVMLNLYLNAIQSMEEGGELIVRAHAIERDNMVTITVIDTGCGMDEDFLGRATDPYFTSKADGTGLGLALAYKIIDEHHGSISLASVLNQGTTVTILLPIQPIES